MTRLVPQWPGMDPGEAGGGCFPRAVAPKVSPSKISMVIRSCTAPAPPYLRAWIAKHCHAARHRRSSSLLPWVFARCETMLRGDIPRTGLFVIVIPIRFVEHVFFNETIAQSKCRLIQGVRNRWFDVWSIVSSLCIDRIDLCFSSSSNLRFSLIQRKREREREEYFI